MTWSVFLATGVGVVAVSCLDLGTGVAYQYGYRGMA